METLNLALIGCGRYGSGYVQAIERTQGARLAVACDTNAEHARRAAAGSGAVAETDWRAALETPGLHAAIIATPNNLHSPIALAAAARGLHVLCEKPLATTLEDARRVVVACESAGVVLAVGLSSRYRGAFQAGEALVREGRLGVPLLVTSAYHYALSPAEPGRTWHSDPAQMGGGALIQMGIHSVDRVCWYAGLPPRRVYAQVREAGECWSDNLALCTIAFEGELLGQVEVVGVAAPFRNALTVHLSRGQIVVTDQRLAWREADSGADDGGWHETEYETDYLATEVADLAEAIREGRAPLASGQAALPAHEVVFAAYRSSAEGQVVAL